MKNILAIFLSLFIIYLIGTLFNNGYVLSAIALGVTSVIVFFYLALKPYTKEIKRD